MKVLLFDLQEMSGGFRLPTRFPGLESCPAPFELPACRVPAEFFFIGGGLDYLSSVARKYYTMCRVLQDRVRFHIRKKR